MGLGKTIQVLSLLLLIKNKLPTQPHLLVVPASLLSNWLLEISRFSPSLRVWSAHSSLSSADELDNANEETIGNYDLVITTYTFLQRLTWLQQINWDVLILDEAQVIKNPNTKQTRCVKSLKCQVRFALTGTPIENRLGDLWSLFDFTCPGLLGTSKSFNNYAKKHEEQDDHFYGAIRTLVSPYILRRLKSDKSIINDLPDKTEIKTFCSLSKRQITLYQQSLEELLVALKTTDGIQRRGLVLSYIMRFKQICNHPTQWLGHGSYDEAESGKFIRLKEICEEIAAKQEKVLIFTQFREAMPALLEHLTTIFGQPGLMLHGQTPINERGGLVKQFNEDFGAPFFILSLKAGGTGLNLTKASHVIHFDRWWNPAVENQATDRAYRIGQHKNVVVHKFICRGTIEEKIDAMIESKKELSTQLLVGVKELSLTELSNDDLIKVVSLDIHRILKES
jgi:non-specific serine/threonine protein kinase